MNKKIEGFVLKTAVYKETNLIVSVLTRTGIVSFKAVSALKVPYKLNSLIQLFTFAEFELVSSDDDARNVLIGGKVLRSNNELYSDFEAQTLLTFIAEIIIRDENVSDTSFELMEYVFSFLRKKEYYKNIILYALKKLLKANGSLLESDCCANCGSKLNIVTVSIPSGGFICGKCNKTFNYEIKDIEYLKGYRYIVKAEMKNLDSFILSQQVYNQLFLEMTNFLEKNCGIKLNSKKLLEIMF